jgi:hypothetical protein
LLVYFILNSSISGKQVTESSSVKSLVDELWQKIDNVNLNDIFSDKPKTIRIPFPCIQTSLRFSVDEDSSFIYFKRSGLLRFVIEKIKKASSSKSSIQHVLSGLSGIGKSYLVAVAVVCLLKEGFPIVYNPDCSFYDLEVLVGSVMLSRKATNVEKLDILFVVDNAQYFSSYSTTLDNKTTCLPFDVQPLLINRRQFLVMSNNNSNISNSIQSQMQISLPLSCLSEDELRAWKEEFFNGLVNEDLWNLIVFYSGEIPLFLGYFRDILLEKSKNEDANTRKRKSLPEKNDVDEKEARKKSTAPSASSTHIVIENSMNNNKNFTENFEKVENSIKNNNNFDKIFEKVENSIKNNNNFDENFEKVENSIKNNNNCDENFEKVENSIKNNNNFDEIIEDDVGQSSLLNDVNNSIVSQFLEVAVLSHRNRLDEFYDKISVETLIEFCSSVVLGCGFSLSSKYVDKRYFELSSEKKVIAMSGFVFDYCQNKLNLLLMTQNTSNFKQNLSNLEFSLTPISMGIQTEAVLVDFFTATKCVLKFKVDTVIKLLKNSEHLCDFFNNCTTLYVPTVFNYKGIDLLLFSSEINGAFNKKTIMGIQITNNKVKRHLDSIKNFMILLKYLNVASDEKIDLKLVYITRDGNRLFKNDIDVRKFKHVTNKELKLTISDYGYSDVNEVISRKIEQWYEIENTRKK